MGGTVVAPVGPSFESHDGHANGANVIVVLPILSMVPGSTVARSVTTLVSYRFSDATCYTYDRRARGKRLLDQCSDRIASTYLSKERCLQSCVVPGEPERCTSEEMNSPKLWSLVGQPLELNLTALSSSACHCTIRAD